METPSNIIKESGKAIDNATTTAEEAAEQATERLKIDMYSDNWLSKSIRPIVLIWLMLLFTWSYVYTQVTGLAPDLTMTNLLSSLLTTAIIFYFGSKAGERISSIWASTNKKIVNEKQRAERPPLINRIFGSKHAKATPKSGKK